MKIIRNICIICLLFITLIIISNNEQIISLGNNKKTNMQGANKSVPMIQGKVFEADKLLQEGPDGKYEVQNTKYLQELIDQASFTGGAIVKIPAGTYYFGVGEGHHRIQNGNVIESWAITCRNNVTIIGEGQDQTILKPYGVITSPSKGGIDMFFFNDYALNDKGNYLVNASFKNFTIDGSEAKGEIYNSSGKGFMINLFRNCSWDNVTVKNTSGTGFGIDCPINSSITNCIAEGCGKDAEETSYGASGFGIGIGFSEDESIYIYNSVANNNKKYGFFFGHQGKFNSLTDIRYMAQKSQGFVISNCLASGNQYDFGGERAYDVTYENCSSKKSNSRDWDDNNKSALHFADFSVRCHVVNFEVEKQFNDVTDKLVYYYEPVYWAQKNAIVEGSGKEWNFSPNTFATKAQAVIFLHRLSELAGNNIVYGKTENELNEQLKTEYSDVLGSASYASAVKWAVDNSIVSVGADKKFYPNNTCTRAEFITMLYNYAGKPEVTGSNPFKDVESTDPFKNAAIWAGNLGIVNGTRGATFNPNAECTKAMIVTFLYRYVNTNTFNLLGEIEIAAFKHVKINNVFNITYNLLGGTLDRYNPTRYTAGADSFTLNNPTKKGYVFNGWTGSNIVFQGYTTTNYIPNKSVTIYVSDLGNKTYSANWTPISYRVQFNANGGTGTMDDEMFTYDVPQSLDTNSYTKPGYVFKEWNTKPDGSGVSYKDGALINNNQQLVEDALISANNCITLYAQWVLEQIEFGEDTNSKLLGERKSIFNWNTAKISVLTSFQTVDIDTNKKWDNISNSNVDAFCIIPIFRYINQTYSYNDEKDFVIETSRKIISSNKNARIFIGLPIISDQFQHIGDTRNDEYNKIYFLYKTFLRELRDELLFLTTNNSTDTINAWDNNVVGFYWTTETIYEDSSKETDKSKVVELLLINDISNVIHYNYNKEFLWIPYYGVGNNEQSIIKNIAYVANQKNYFDAVIMQPGYMFNYADDTEYEYSINGATRRKTFKEATYQNLDAIKYSIQKQAVCWRDGSLVYEKVSNTYIGAEFEYNRWYDSSDHSNNIETREKNRLNAWKEYVSKFEIYIDNAPTAFFYNSGEIYDSWEQMDLLYGHNLDDGEITQEPTCTKKGIKTYRCIVCEIQKKEDIAETGHEYIPITILPTCTQEGYIKYTCKECGDTYVGDKVPANGHELIEEVCESTCVNNGYKNFKCKNCNYVKMEEKIATGHNYQNDVCTICGYNNAKSRININFNNYDGNYNLLKEAKFNISISNMKSLEYKGEYCTPRYGNTFTISKCYLQDVQLKNVEFYNNETIYITLQEIEAPEGYDLLNNGKEIYIEVPKGEWPIIVDAPNSERNVVSNKLVDVILFDGEEPSVVVINIFRNKKQATNEMTILSVGEPKIETKKEENTQNNITAKTETKTEENTQNNTTSKTTTATNNNTTANKKITSLFLKSINILRINKYKSDNTKTAITTTPKQNTTVEQNNTVTKIEENTQNNTVAKTETKTEENTQNNTVAKTETKTEENTQKNTVPKIATKNILTPKQIITVKQNSKIIIYNVLKSMVLKIKK